MASLSAPPNSPFLRESADVDDVIFYLAVSLVLNVALPEVKHGKPASAVFALMKLVEILNEQRILNHSNLVKEQKVNPGIRYGLGIPYNLKP